MSKFILTASFLVLLGSFVYYPHDTMAKDELSRHTTEKTIIFPVSEQIKLARCDKRLSQAQLSTLIGISQLTYERIENGKIMPNSDILFQLEKVLHTRFNMKTNL
jgi:ribosome-binding protein aMBF1 (putative translation factor)